MSSARNAVRYAALIAFATSLLARAQDADPMARVTAAAALTSLELADQKPWHLALDVTVFDAKGANPASGTIEVWHAGENERTVYTFGDASDKILRLGAKVYRTASGPPVPAEAYEVLAEVLKPGPTASDLTGSKPEVTKLKGKLPLDCIMLTRPIKGAGTIPLGLFPTYCLDDGGVIRTTFDFGARTVVLNAMGKFLDHKVPTQVDILDGQTKVGTGKVTTLTTYTPQPDEFAAPPDVVAGTGMARLSGSVIAGSRVGFVQPVYPQAMKEARQSGTVILHAIIGNDGRVHSLHPVNATDPEFVIAAIAAVRQWTYKPYTLNGVPTEVDTTITVNFQMNP